MSINTSASPKIIPARRVLLTGLIIILGIVVTAGFVGMQADQVIAPPGLRLMDGLWKLFICRCPDFPDLLGI
jgi:hypothetical protein